MSAELIQQNKKQPLDIITQSGWTEEEIQIIKETICKGANEAEFKAFVRTCVHLSLDPFRKQIYSIPRKVSGETIRINVVSIDGLRLIAERTGKYAPGSMTTYKYNDKNHLISATAYVKKLTKDGTWHEIGVEAFYHEYVQMYNQKPSGVWKDKPHVMLSKCAEALALRKAFPAEMSSVYAEEEFNKPEKEDSSPKVDTSNFINEAQFKSVKEIIGEDLELIEKILNAYRISKLSEIPKDKFQDVLKRIFDYRNKIAAKEVVIDAEVIENEEVMI